MPTIERTPAESVARCNTPGAQHATPARRAQHAEQTGRATLTRAGHKSPCGARPWSGSKDATARATPSAAPPLRGVASAMRGAQHPAEHGRTACERAGWRDYFEAPRSAGMMAACPAPMLRPARWRIALRGGALSIPSRLQAIALAFNAARRGLIRQCSHAAAMRGCIANAGRQ